MPFIKRVFILIGIMVLLASGNGLAQDNKTVSVITLPDYAPYTMKKNDSTDRGVEKIAPGEDSKVLGGYSWDIVRESFHSVGWTVELKTAPWKRAMNLFKKGKFDVLWPTGKNTKRLKIFDYSDEPINKANFVIYVKADSNLQWDGLQTLKGKTIGTRRGFTYGNKWNEHKESFKIHETDKTITGFKLLKAVRIDGFAGYDINWDYALKQSGMDASLFKKLPPFGQTTEHAVCLKTNERSKEILNTFDKGKKNIIKDGTFEQISQKWLGK